MQHDTGGCCKTYITTLFFLCIGIQFCVWFKYHLLTTIVEKKFKQLTQQAMEPNFFINLNVLLFKERMNARRDFLPFKERTNYFEVLNEQNRRMSRDLAEIGAIVPSQWGSNLKPPVVWLPEGQRVAFVSTERLSANG